VPTIQPPEIRHADKPAGKFGMIAVAVALLLQAESFGRDMIGLYRAGAWHWQRPRMRRLKDPVLPGQPR
jgi:hypothetical protein